MNTNPQIKITDLSHDGRGIAHLNGKTIFISGALPNEIVTFNYTRKHSQFDEAVIDEIIESSEQRVTPKCQHFGICGGCSLQHMSHALQLELKQNALINQLQHFGKIIPENILPPISAEIWGYRRKARLSIKYVNKKNKVLVGFREKNKRYIADISSCPVLHKTVGENINKISELISSLSIFKEIPQIEIAVDDNKTAMVVRHLAEFTVDDLNKIADFAKKYNYYIFLQPNNIDSIYLFADSTTTYSQTQRAKNEKLSYSLPDHNLVFKFNPTDFTQINSGINNKMVNLALELLEPQSNETILDLFCGIGNFTLPLAKKCRQIIGVEGNAHAVEQAKLNATINNLNNTRFYCNDLTLDLATKEWSTQQFNKILLDPPRSGALEIATRINKFKAQKILYISCNPATLARDAGEIIKQNYKLTTTGIIDMFPHTAHVESIALFDLAH